MNLSALASYAARLHALGLQQQPLAKGQVVTGGNQAVARFKDEGDAAFFVAAVAFLGTRDWRELSAAESDAVRTAGASPVEPAPAPAALSEAHHPLTPQQVDDALGIVGARFFDDLNREAAERSDEI